MEPRDPSVPILHELLTSIAERWRQLDDLTGCTPPAPWGYLVGVDGSPDHTPEPSWWPQPHDWQPHCPRPGFTTLRQHPAVALRGFVAPHDWQAVGVAVHGVARRVGTTRTGRAGVVWLCHRNGSTASWLSLPGDEPVVTISNPTNDRDRPDLSTQGVVAGLLRRSLRH
jgi:hypothetical protein